MNQKTTILSHEFKVYEGTVPDLDIVLFNITVKYAAKKTKLK